MPDLERVEARTQELGRGLLAAAGEYRPGVAERIEDWLLTHAVADEPSNGTATINALTGQFVYTPDPQYHGPDSFTVTVTDDDLIGGGVPARVGHLDGERDQHLHAADQGGCRLGAGVAGLQQQACHAGAQTV